MPQVNLLGPEDGLLPEAHGLLVLPVSVRPSLPILMTVHQGQADTCVCS